MKNQDRVIRIEDLEGVPEKKRRPTEERFWAKVEKAGADECWGWIGSRLKNGYGTFRLGVKGVNRKMHLAHRVSFLLSRGEMTEGLLVLHTCDTPFCCNPRHLLQGTQTDNMQDCIAKKRRAKTTWVSGVNNGRAKLNEGQVKEIRAIAPSASIEYLASRFNITTTTIRNILNRKLWRHVT